MFRFAAPGAPLLLGVGLQLADAQLEWLGWVFIGLAGIWILALLVASVVRKPLQRYRERHLLKRWGQECMVLAQAMVDDLPLKVEGDIGQFKDADAEAKTMRRYNFELAPRIYATARELERLDVIDRSRREELATAPDDLAAYFVRVEELADLGSRLGGTPVAP